MYVAHFKIVSEHIVVADFQTAYSGLLRFAFLYLQQVVLAVVCNVSCAVQLLVHSVSYHVSLVYELWRVRFYLHFYAVAEFLAVVNLLSHQG